MKTATASKKAVSSQGANDKVTETIQGAKSHDLVFAVIGHAGAGATHVAIALLEGLKSRGQRAHTIKMSKLIEKAAQKIDGAKWVDTSSSERLVRASALQKAGNWLREKKGPAFTAGLAVREMHEVRTRRDPTDLRIAFVIDCLKNKQEVEALRQVYGRSFYLLSVICDPDTRERRLRMKYRQGYADFAHCDEGEDNDFGQQVRKTIQLGDFFVNNTNDETKRTSDEEDAMNRALSRFLQLVFGTEVVRPTSDERGMYAAWSASLRSSCMSRQVGAAIVDENNQLIATGTNDAPKFGGGLYEEGDDPDYRCFKYPKPHVGHNDHEPTGFCRNDITKDQIYAEIIGGLRHASVLAANVDDEKIRSLIEKTAIADLIEFSRAVHAEMDALISLARSGSGAARNGTLYCRTYPCHSCARHIVAAGIRDVIYIEPYTKSRAMSLHDDSIKETTDKPNKDSKHVHFRLFTGVAPRRFEALFEKREEIKTKGRLYLRQASDVAHQDHVFTKSHVDFEKSIADRVSKLETENEQ